MAGQAEAIRIIDEILDLLKREDVRSIGAATQRNFFGPIQTIIPWATTLYTETLIRQVAEEFGSRFWGFWMMGGMSGGGMGFMFDPGVKPQAQARLQEIMSAAKQRLEAAVPFAMEPVVYDFAINERGTFAELLTGEQALMPAGYYAQTVPALVRHEQRSLSPFRRAELDRFAAACRTERLAAWLDAIRPAAASADVQRRTRRRWPSCWRIRHDRVRHERIKADMRSGRIGLAQNRLPVTASRMCTKTNWSISVQ